MCIECRKMVREMRAIQEEVRSMRVNDGALNEGE